MASIKVLTKTTKVLCVGNKACVIGAFTKNTSYLASKKENYTHSTKHYNYRLKDGFTTNSLKSYSTTTSLSEDNSFDLVTTETNQEVALNPKEVINWTKEEVSFLLITKEEKGGAGLSVETVKPLYDSGFRGNSIVTIVGDLLKRKGDSYPVDECCNSFPNVPRDTIKYVVNWVDKFKPRLYHMFSAEQLQELCKGDIKISSATIETLFGDSLDGNYLVSFKNGSNMNLSSDQLKVLKTISNWVDRISKPLSYEIDVFKHYLITGQVYDKNSLLLFSILLGKCMESVKITNSNNLSSALLTEKQERAKNSLGKLANPKGEWPFVFSGDKVMLDWRFSNIILPSKLESDTLKSNTHDAIISNLNNQFATEEDHKITILLALSGAGKTHSLFHISNTNTAFCLPLDFGSKEDIHLRHCQKELDYLRSFTLIPNRDNDTNIQQKNQEACSKMSSAITTSIMVRAIVLLKLLQYKRKEGSSLQPSEWIRFVYNGGSQIIKDLFEFSQKLLQEVNQTTKFLIFVLGKLSEELNYNTCTRFVITVDEINELMFLGYGYNTIPSTEGTRYTSVLTLMCRILEDCRQISPSMMSGTRVSNSLVEEIVSARMKHTLQIYTAYGPTEQPLLLMFAKHYLRPPKTNLGFGCTLFEAILSVLAGRRRIFTKYLSRVISLSSSNPCPTNNQNIWADKILLKALEVYTDSIPYFVADVAKYFLVEEAQLDIAKTEIGLHLLFKNKITSEELKQILLNCQVDNRNIPRIHDAIISNGLGFGKIDEPLLPTAFHLKEILIMLSLSTQLQTEEMIKFVNEWLKQTLNTHGGGRNSEIGAIFEVIGALILRRLAEILNGSSLSDHPIFSQFKNSLNGFALPKTLSIVRSEHYWKFLLIPHWEYSIAASFRDVCVFGLDQLKIDVKTLISRNEEQFIDVNMSSKFITNPSHNNKELEHNFYATDINNAFLCNDLQNVQPDKQYRRRELMKHEYLTKKPTVRIVFDYNSNISLQDFEELVKKDNKKKQEQGKPNDFIVLLSKNNPEFMNFFEQEFTYIHQTIKEHLQKK